MPINIIIDYYVLFYFSNSDYAISFFRRNVRANFGLSPPRPTTSFHAKLYNQLFLT